MSIIKHVTLQKIVAHDFRYDPRIYQSTLHNISKDVNFRYNTFWMRFKFTIPVFLVTQVIFIQIAGYMMVILTRNIKMCRERIGFPVRVYYKLTERIITPTSWELIETLIKHLTRNPSHMHILAST